MKKFYLIMAALMACVSVSAKEITFSLGDKPVADKSTVYFDKIEVESYEGGMDVMMNPGIVLTSDVSADNLIIVVECKSGQRVQLCAGGECRMGTKITKTDVAVQAGTPLPLMFEYMGFGLSSDKEIPVVETVISAQYADDPGSYRSFTIIMGKDLNGVDDVETTPDTLKCIPGAIEYSVSGSTLLTLADIEGKVIVRQTLTGSGTIPTDELQKGVYIYTLGDKKGKLYIH